MKNKVRWIITLIVGIFLTAAVIGLAIKLDRSTDSERLGAEAYSIGTIDSAGDIDTKSDGYNKSIYTRKAIKVSDISSIEALASDATITYTLHYYTANDKWIKSGVAFDGISSDSELKSVDGLNVRIVITLKETAKDEEFTLTNISKYADQLVVKLKK